MNKTTLSLSIILSSIILTTNLFSNQNSENKNNVIYLIGEDHVSPECQKIENQLLKDAQNGKIILAKEAIYFNANTNDNIFGIEEPYAKVLADSWGFYQQFVMYKFLQDFDPSGRITHLMPFTSSIKYVFNMFFSSPSYRLGMIHGFIHSIEDHLPSIYKKNPEIIGEFLNLYKLKRSSLPSYEETVSKYLKNHSFENPFFLNIHPDISLWISLFKDLLILSIEETVRLNEGNYPDSLNSIIDFIEKIENGLKSKDYTFISEISDFEEFFVKNIILNHRNQIFFKNIISIYEENKFQEKPFYVFVGSCHIPFLKEALKQKGLQVELNDWEQYCNHWKQYYPDFSISEKSEL